MKALLSAIALSAVLFGSTTFALADAPTANPRPEQLKHLQGSLRALSSALQRIGKEKQRQEFTGPILEKVHKLEQGAQQLIVQQQPAQALHDLQLAMDVIKTGIATLRNQETLTRSLDFASPADEYRYELERYKGYMMLAHLLSKHQDNANIKQLKQQAEALAEAANQQAVESQYQDALDLQERCNKLIVQAIRRSGLYI